jgi:hypothetical protein
VLVYLTAAIAAHRRCQVVAVPATQASDTITWRTCLRVAAAHLRVGYSSGTLHNRCASVSVHQGVGVHRVIYSLVES